MTAREPRAATICGFACTVNDALGHVEVAHDGAITWDDLQAIKTALWGDTARAIEVYPASGDIVNGGNYRHLWRLGSDDFCPDLLVGFHDAPTGDVDDRLSVRVMGAWLGANDVFSTCNPQSEQGMT